MKSKNRMSVTEFARLGGLARAKLSKEKLSEIGRKAAESRWNKCKQASCQPA